MSVVFTPYDPETGRLHGHIATCEQGKEIYAESGLIWVGGVYSTDTHYILNGEVTERPASPVSRTGLTLLDVPTGSTLWINGVSYPAEGTVELDFTYPGTYALRVECFPYLDWTDEVVIP